MEGGKGVAEKKGVNEVVLQIQGSEDSKGPSLTETSSYSFSKNSHFGSSPESGLSPNSNKPPKIPTETLTRRKSLARSVFSKPKSRFVEPAYVGEASLVTEKTQLVKQVQKTQLVNTNSTSTSNRNSPNVASPSHKVSVSTPRDHLKSAPITPRTPFDWITRRRGGR
uniref:DUF4005 domain-containing protein n=1 Tax=Fagus sylvatica TaxID=28930 RepID=A0A2N9F885_FAGSY